MSILFTFDTSIQLTRAATNQFGKIKMATKSIKKRLDTVYNEVCKLSPNQKYSIFGDFYPKKSVHTHSVYVAIGAFHSISVRVSDHAKGEFRSECHIDLVEGSGLHISAKWILKEMMEAMECASLEEFIEYYVDEEMMKYYGVSIENFVKHLSKFL